MKPLATGLGVIALSLVIVRHALAALGVAHEDTLRSFLIPVGVVAAVLFTLIVGVAS
jgi:hypothetical protein